MAKIRDAHPKSSSGGYDRVFDDAELGGIIQKVQSTVISNGTELEKMLSGRSETIGDLEEFITACKDGEVADGAYLCLKKTIQGSPYRLKSKEPDQVVFELRGHERICYIIELKDGDQFDTKKSAGERAALAEYADHLGRQVPFITRFYICCFNQPNKELIVSGLKGRFSLDEVMTGGELCDLLGVDYAALTDERKADAEDNVDYFVSEFVKIPVVKTRLSEERRLKISEPDFYGDGPSG